MGILDSLKKFNDENPQYHGMIYLVLFDDGSGSFYCDSKNQECLADVYYNEKTGELSVQYLYE